MNPTFKKTLLNFLMIQAVIFITSASIAGHIPAIDSVLSSITLVWLCIFVPTLIPSLAVSFWFACFTE